jgi:NOL1/NOP2/fmu family ribosome biogenesis protein
VKGEGFFIAAFRKQGFAEIKDHTSVMSRSKTKNKQVLTAKETETVKPYLADAGNFFFTKQNEEAIALPVHLEDELAIIRSSLYIKKAGVKLGTIIRNELIPSHELAVSNIINAAVSTLEADNDTALQYLRKADVSIESESRGWVLLTYQQLPLGWIKIMPGRINNYYPKEWRILNK